MRCVSNLPSPPDWVRHEAWLLQSVMYFLHAHNCIALLAVHVGQALCTGAAKL